MPVQESERVSFSTLKQYDVLAQPDVGDRYKQDSPFKGTIIIAQSSDRISVPVSPQETQKRAESANVFSTGSINFNSDFEQLDILHTKLGMKPAQRLSHDPAMERARYLRAKTEGERQAVKQGIIVNMERTLYERAFTSQSEVRYYQDDEGKIYHPDFPGEAFDVVLQRGIEYSKRAGFVDYEREVKEFAGLKEALTVLFNFNTPLRKKTVIISGPGLKKSTAFTDNFVDIFTKTIDPHTGRVIVVMTRFASGADYDQYNKIADKLDGNYFAAGEITKGQEDLYYKEHPIFIDSDDLRSVQQLFAEEFIKQKGVTEEEKTKGYLAECRLLILDYVETICAEFLNPKAVEKSFRAVLNKFDALREDVVEVVSHISKGVLEFGRNAVYQASVLVNRAKVSFRSLQEERDYYGGMPVKAMMVGCGLSADFSTTSGGLGGILKFAGGMVSNAVSFLGGVLGFSKDKDYCIKCGACGREIKRVVRRGERCPFQDCKAIRRC